ncbi:hypothetical protein KQI84_08425 [bacterium]|nr:hypothetical protein [bacterium]
MKVVDPLKLAIARELRSGQFNPLARLRDYDYGTLQHERDLRLALEAILPHESPAVIDFTPFSALSIAPDRVSAFLELMASPLSSSDGFALVRGESKLEKALREEWSHVHIPFISFDREGNLVERFAGHNSKLLVDLQTRFPFSTLLEFRQFWSDRLFRKYLSAGGIILPTESNGFFVKTEIEGKPFLQMDNGMYTSCYLSIKHMLTRPQDLLDCAYEVTYRLLGGYCDDTISHTRDVDTLVVANQSSLFVAAAVQAITGIQLCVIDKVGPIPAKRISAARNTVLSGARAALLAEVMATGAEIDKALMVLNAIDTEVCQVICCFNLSIGRPFLVSPESIFSLCTPREEIRYVYRSG